MKTARKFGNSLGIFTNFLLGDPSAPRKNVINFDAAAFTLDRFTLTNESVARQKVRDAYLEHGTKVILLVQAKLAPPTRLTAEQARTLFGEILTFEIEAAGVRILHLSPTVPL